MTMKVSVCCLLELLLVVLLLSSASARLGGAEGEAEGGNQQQQQQPSREAAQRRARARLLNGDDNGPPIFTNSTTNGGGVDAGNGTTIVEENGVVKILDANLKVVSTSDNANDNDPEAPGVLSFVHAQDASAKLDNEYILRVSRRIEVLPLVQEFELLQPHATVKHVFTDAYHGFSVRGVTEEQVRAFADGCHNMVLEIQENAQAHTSATTSEMWGLDRIDQRGTVRDGAYNPLATGEGVKIYVVDTGVRFTHEEFKGRIEQGVDKTGEGPDAYGNVQFDGNGHGTHVAGTCAGTKYGVAKGATIVPVKVLNSQGTGGYDDIIAGIDWVAQQHRNSYNRKSVANLSLGGGRSDSLNQAVEAAAAAGVVMVVAAGNEDQDACVTSPASAASAITVGSTDMSDKRSTFSNWGSCVDIFAPGSSIKSATSSGDSATTTLSGTSMASPHVAGAAALVLQSETRITGNEAWKILDDIASTGKVAGRKGSPNKLLYMGDIVGVDPPSQPSGPQPGTVTFIVVYDTYIQETRFDIWEKEAGKKWRQLQSYRPPQKAPTPVDPQHRQRKVVERIFSDGVYAFDIHDTYGDGIESGYTKNYVPGGFALVETETDNVIHRGGDFKSYFSVEFKVQDGVISVEKTIDL